MIFPLGHIYPYTDLHDLNLDWIIRTVKAVTKEVDDFIAYNKVTFRGTWDGSAYPAWTIVDDGNGDGYLALKPVPANVPLSDSEYWTQVAAYSSLYSAFNSRIAALEANDLLQDSAISGLGSRVTTAEGNITTLSARSTTSVTANGITFTFIKVGSICQMIPSGNADSDVDAGDTIAMIPAGYRPAATFEAWDSYRQSRLYVQSTGEITSGGNLTTGQGIRGLFTYILP